MQLIQPSSFITTVWGPVVSKKMTRPEAASFIAELNRRTGLNWRLPTREESQKKSGSGLTLMLGETSPEGYAYFYSTSTGSYGIGRGRGTAHLPLDVQLIRNTRIFR